MVKPPSHGPGDDLGLSHEQRVALSRTDWYEPRDLYESLQRLVQTCEGRAGEFAEAEIRVQQGGEDLTTQQQSPFMLAVNKVAHFLKALRSEFETTGINQVPLVHYSVQHQAHQLTEFQRRLLSVENNPVDRKIKELFTDVEMAARPIIDSRKRRPIMDHHTVTRDRIGGFINEAEFCSAAMGQRAGVGGYDTISLLLNNQPGGSTLCGAFIDNLFLKAPVAEAHRMRVKDLAAMIRIALTNDQSTGRFELTSVACGPARELSDFVNLSGGSTALSRLHMTLVDHNLDALHTAVGSLEATGYAELRTQEGQIGPTFVTKQLDIGALLGHYSQGIPPVRPAWLLHPPLPDRADQGQDAGPRAQAHFTEAAGIIDYFSNDASIALGCALLDETLDGGLVVMTAVDPNNPDRGVQGAALKWVLITRDKEDMKQLAAGIKEKLDRSAEQAAQSEAPGRSIPKFDAKFREDISSVGSLLNSLNPRAAAALKPGEFAVVSGMNGLNWYLVMRKNTN